MDRSTHCNKKPPSQLGVFRPDFGQERTSSIYIHGLFVGQAAKGAHHLFGFKSELVEGLFLDHDNDIHCRPWIRAVVEVEAQVDSRE